MPCGAIVRIVIDVMEDGTLSVDSSQVPASEQRKLLRELADTFGTTVKVIEEKHVHKQEVRGKHRHRAGESHD